MRVLIACEFSGVVREAFRKRGHDAWSCDLLPAEDGNSHHFQRDVVEVLRDQGHWDITILHPPCTCIALCGNSTYGKGKPRHQERIASLVWTVELWKLALTKSRRVALENPQNVLSRALDKKKSQTIQPYQFGHLEQKETWLWLHELSSLKPTHDVYEEMMKLPRNVRERIHYMSPKANRGQERSRTFTGIDDAMAEQWGGDVR